MIFICFLAGSGPSRAVADADDIDRAALDTIADQIGPDQRQLSKAVSDRPAAMGKGTQPIAGIDDARGQALRRRRIELPDVDADGLDIGQRLPRPDYARHESGSGFSSGVSHFSSHAATSA
jgi:hypothetical protein